MYNPSYLTQSRHNIYYFRFPLASKGRNKNGLIGKLPLLEQITTRKEHNLPCIGKVSVNKYLAYFDNLFGWAKDNRYTSDNIFSGIRVIGAISGWVSSAK